MATKTVDKFKCPKCGSGRTKPVSIAIASGTRRRSTVGVSRRSMWGSSSTYKSDLVCSLPQRPSNAGAYLLMFVGVGGLLFALLVGSADKNATGIAVMIGFVALLFLFGGIGAKKKPEDWLPLSPVGTSVGCVRVAGTGGKHTER